ncbi:Undecaprenyl-diphosphatase [Variovorax sp. SRS16]|uniref:undecaprenyl-diphosphate phosphatase n=1 Tax=Variovorax sp. SRS16 TaxID=282217 RepID=UPI0013175289|nr:undecaprenyl-diphosphate phosphatase [Variovorax sp. SRS16]VTU16618.1 Undecaprenyl-diphosphatase [Variovorax sp. SRS16]
MTLLQITVLALVQGIAELLPVSSSAHVILAEKLMHLDPTAPDMTLLLVMLHTGTMFAVIVYFWTEWKATYFSSGQAFRRNAGLIVIATAATGLVGLVLLKLIPYALGANRDTFEIEHLFGNVYVIAGGLAAAGVLILVSGLRMRTHAASEKLKPASALSIGVVQGLCLPFRGFSRSGATISTGLLTGVSRLRAEEFSFALAVVLTPAVIAREAYRLFKSSGGLGAGQWLHLALPSLLGMAISFVAGMIALRWLSRWLENGRWHYFGIYCLAMSAVVLSAQGRVL